MSRTEAVARARTLREALLDHGVGTVSIELVVGRPGGPNGGWWDGRFVATLGHHIVSRRSQGLTPFLSLVKDGRSDLPGPICNGYGGFDRVARIVCMGWANHPGQGGPVTVQQGTIPANNARPYLFGWEFEGGIEASDWPESMREFMGACHAGTLAWLGVTEASHLEHKSWAPARKVDRLGYTLAAARAEAARNLGDAMPHTHTPAPTVDDPEWAVGPWAEWVKRSDTAETTSHWNFERRDLGWVYGRVIAPLEAKVAALEAEVASLAGQVASGGLTEAAADGRYVRKGQPVRIT